MKKVILFFVILAVAFSAWATLTDSGNIVNGGIVQRDAEGHAVLRTLPIDPSGSPVATPSGGAVVAVSNTITVQGIVTVIVPTSTAIPAAGISINPLSTPVAPWPISGVVTVIVPTATAVPTPCGGTYQLGTCTAGTANIWSTVVLSAPAGDLCGNELLVTNQGAAQMRYWVNASTTPDPGYIGISLGVSQTSQPDFYPPGSSLHWTFGDATSTGTYHNRY